MCLVKETRVWLAAIGTGVAIRSQMLGLELWMGQHHTANRIEATRVQLLPVLVEVEGEFRAAQLAQVLKSHTNAVIMEAVGNKNFQRVGRDVQVLLVVYSHEETTPGMKGYGLRNMVIEPVDFEVVLNQTSCSREAIAHEEVCD
jgi:hypothetical protein